jgi:hypothetical protein
MGASGSLGGQPHRESRPAAAALFEHRAAGVVRHDVAGDGQAEPGAVFPRREEGVEDVGPRRLGNAGPPIADAHDGALALRGCLDAHARLDRALHGLTGVDEQLEQSLGEQLRGAFDPRQGISEPALQPGRPAAAQLRQAHRVMHEIVDVDGDEPLTGCGREAPHVRDDPLDASDALEGLLRHLAQIAQVLRELRRSLAPRLQHAFAHGGQLTEVGAHVGQGVVDLVRDAGGERPHRLELPGTLGDLGGAELLGAIAQHGDQARGRLAAIGLDGGHAYFEATAIRAAEGDALRARRSLQALEALLQRDALCLGCHLGENGRQRPAMEGGLGAAQESRGGRIVVEDLAAAIRDQDPVAQLLDDFRVGERNADEQSIAQARGVQEQHREQDRGGHRRILPGDGAERRRRGRDGRERGHGRQGGRAARAAGSPRLTCRVQERRRRAQLAGVRPDREGPEPGPPQPRGPPASEPTSRMMPW